MSNCQIATEFDTDVSAVYNYTVNIIIDFPSAILNLIAAVIFLLFANWKLALVATLVFPIIYLFIV